MANELATEPPSTEEAHAILTQDNDRRVEEIKERTGRRVDLEHAFDSERAITYLKHVCVDLGILDRADLDFQNRRSELLDRIETEINEHEEALAQAKAAARLARPQHDGRITHPPGPARIVRPGE